MTESAPKQPTTASLPKEPTPAAQQPKKSLKLSSSARVFVPGAGLMAPGTAPTVPMPFGMQPAATFPPMAQQRQPLEGAPLRHSLQQQIEYYFSQNNLAKDTFLKSKMDADQFVPIDLICGFPNIKHMFGDKTVDRELVVSVMRSSPMLTVSENGEKVAPKHHNARKTLILRDIPNDATTEEVENLFQLPNCPAKPTSTKKEVNGQWFATFKTEDECTNTVMFLRSKNFRDHPVHVGVKSENAQYRAYYAPTGAASAAAAAVGGLPPSMPPMDPQTAAMAMYFGYPPFYSMPQMNGGFQPTGGHPRGQQQQQGDGRSSSGTGGRFSQRGGKRGGGRGGASTGSGGRGTGAGGSGRKNPTGGQRRTSGQGNTTNDRGQRRTGGAGGRSGGQQGQRRGGSNSSAAGKQPQQQQEAKVQGSQQPVLFPSVSPSSKEDFPELPARGRPAQPAKALSPKPKIVYSKKQMAEIVEKLRTQSTGVSMPPFMQSKYDPQDRGAFTAIQLQHDRKVQINTPFPIMYPASPSPLLAAKHAATQPPAFSLGKPPLTVNQ